jgi:hypothetical protein
LYILIVVCILISFITIGIAFYCLCSSKIFNLSSNYLRIIIHNIDNEIQNLNVYVEQNNNNKKLNENEINNLFYKNQIKLFDNINNIENKICDYCKKNICNVKFNCGCFCCFDCERKIIKKGKICELCKKNINGIQQISCGICYQNKKEIASFNCHCSMIVCKDCHLKWRKENNICPACRKNLLEKNDENDGNNNL